MTRKNDTKDEIDDEEKQTIYGVVNVSHNGQVIIPAKLRKALNIKQGDQLIVSLSSDGEDIVLVTMKKMARVLKETGFGLKKPY